MQLVCIKYEQGCYKTMQTPQLCPPHLTHNLLMIIVQPYTWLANRLHFDGSQGTIISLPSHPQVHGVV